MSSQYLDFTDADYQELDTFTFQEMVEKPEELRFYTLDEQEIDAYEKLLPKERVSNVQRSKIKYQVSNIRDLYTKYIIETATDYQVREPIFDKQLDWVMPVYSNLKFDMKVYWRPIITKYQKGYYPRMIADLPKPYIPSANGLKYNFDRPTEFVNADGQKPIRALPAFQSSKHVLHEDNTRDIIPIKMTNSEDEVHVSGYYIQKRPYEIPNPLPEHPFLSQNEATYLESTAPLSDVFPSLDAILTHAIPVTTDPYKEGSKFLKLYDVQLSDIPWSSWKSRFPPVDSEFTKREPMDIPTIERKTYEPSNKIIETYKTPYYPGISTREWLMRQDDGGLFVIKALMSTVINSGSVSNIPIFGLTPEYPASTPEECALQGLTYQDFTLRGLLRRTWKLNKDKDELKMSCIPLEFVKQERARAGYKDREQWKETTGLDLITEYLKVLQSYRLGEKPESKDEFSEITPSKPDSPMKLEILAIQHDKNRDDRDKLKDIQLLLQSAILSNHRYTDIEGNQVCCSHTLSVLAGDLEEDRRSFYDTWTRVSDGHRVCKYCGQEVIAVDAVDADEYDQNGVQIKQKDILEVPKNIIVESTTNYISRVSDLAKVFNQADISESLCFQIISILQVLPNVQLLQQILRTSRIVLASLFKNKTKEQIADYASFQASLGIALAIIILQSDPSLVPKRSFGPTALKLTGYPRDNPDPKAEKFTIIDSLIMVIEKTYSGFPLSLTGPTASVIRMFISDSRKIRNTTPIALNNLFSANKQLKGLLEQARLSMDKHVVEELSLLLPAIPPPEKLGTIQTYQPCYPNTKSILASETLPIVHQPYIELRPGLQPSELRKRVLPSLSIRESVAIVSAEAIRIGLNKGKGLSSVIRVRNSHQSNLLMASILADKFRNPLPIRNVDFNQKSDELRDIGQGFLYDVLKTVETDNVKKTELNEKLIMNDASIFCLNMEYTSAKSNVISVKATERLNFVKRMGQLTDDEREVTTELLKRGLAAYIITNEDRMLYASQIETFLNTELQPVLDEEEQNDEVGVGVPQDRGAEEDNGDNGDYGDLQPANPDHDDEQQPTLWDNEND